MPLLSAKENKAILEALMYCGQQAQQAASKSSFKVFEKGHEDYVTTVDQRLDDYLSQVFSAQFPSDGIVTEENQASASEFLRKHERLWFIDPIDGTEEFIHGGQSYSVMAGLLVKNQPRAGWVHAPVNDQIYWGGPDWGLFQQSHGGQAKPLEPTIPLLEENQTVLLGDRDQSRFGSAITQQIPYLRFDTFGSFGLKVLAVIKGHAGLYVYLNGRVKLWDTIGPLALAKAAGLVCCDLDGNPIQFDDNSVYPFTLIHRQPILIGWPAYVKRLRIAIRQAVIAVRTQELALS